MKSFSSHSLAETERIATEWLLFISKAYPNNDQALVVGLSGHLGAGKTAFTKSVAKILGVAEEVTSPTFVIMKIYMLNDRDPMINDQKNAAPFGFPWKRLVHIDAYRLERREELDALDWEKLVADKGNLILIEWPENVGLNEFGQQAHLSFDSIDGVYKIRII
jgi:tRNA threonylcarbamoyladenosine biosynthesis protein TsaE